MPPIVDTLHFCVALVPLALYFLVLGVINIGQRPRVWSGAQETAGLGFAVSGFMLAGPGELFTPTATGFKLGPFVWPLLVVFYSMCVTLLVLLRKPRVVIYNVGVETLRPVLADIVSQLDRDARWAGDCLYLPSLGVQFHIDAVPFLRNVQLISTGTTQSLEGWVRLTKALRGALRQARGPRNLYGWSLVMAGMVLFGAVTFWAVQDAATVAQSLKEIFQTAK